MGRFHEIDQYRKDYIDDIVEEVRKEYYLDENNIDTKKLFEDHGLNVVISPYVFDGRYIKCTFKKQDEDKIFETLLIPDSLRKNYVTASQLGHFFLHHKKGSWAEEKEANYFAEKMTGIGFLDYIMMASIDVTLYMIRHPVAFYRANRENSKPYLSAVLGDYLKKQKKSQKENNS